MRKRNDIQHITNVSELQMIIREKEREISQLRDKLYVAEKEIQNLNSKLEKEKHYKPQYNHYEIYVYSLNHTRKETLDEYGIGRSTYYNIKNEYENKKSKKAKKSKKSLDNS